MLDGDAVRGLPLLEHRRLLLEVMPRIESRVRYVDTKWFQRPPARCPQCGAHGDRRWLPVGRPMGAIPISHGAWRASEVTSNHDHPDEDESEE